MKDLLNRGELWGSVLWDQVVDGFTTAHDVWEVREEKRWQVAKFEPGPGSLPSFRTGEIGPGPDEPLALGLTGGI